MLISVTLFVCLAAINVQPEGAARTTLPDQTLMQTGVDEKTKASEDFARWTKELVSDEPGVSEEARIQLAHGGVRALEYLEGQAASADLLLRVRVKETVKLMLLKTVTPKDLKKCPSLEAMCREELRGGEVIAEKFDASTIVLSPEEGGLAVDGPVRLPETSGELLWMKQLRGLGGFAASGVVRMCESKNAHARMYGVRLIGQLGMTAQVGMLRALETDQERAAVFHGCVNSHEPVAGAAKQFRQSSEFWTPESKADQPVYRPAYEAEKYIERAVVLQGRGYPFDLVNRLRQEAGTLEAADWDEYWNRARPLFREVMRAEREVRLAEPAKSANPDARRGR